MATTTTAQIGTYSALTDSFTLSLDINDRATYYVDTIDVPQAKKETIEVFTIRTVGEQVLAQQHRNRIITITLAIRGATVDAVLAAATALQQNLEKPLPLNMTLKLQAPNATRARYSTVQYVEHDIPYFVKDLVANGLGGKKRVHIALKCLPFSFSIPRQWLSNLVTNPGFEAPSGPGVQVFNDTFATINAYAVQAGGALAQDTLTFADVVDGLNNAAGASSTTLHVLRYFRLDEASGTTAFDASGNAQNGTNNGSPTQGVAGLLTGDSDTCYTFAAASSQYVNMPTTGLPTGNAAISVWVRFKFAANPASNQFLLSYGAGGGGAHNGIDFFLDSTGHLNADVGTGTFITSGVLTTGTNHSALITWDGTTLTLYVDGASVGTSTPGNQTIPTTSTFLRIAATAGTTPSGFYSGQIDEAVVLSGALTSAQDTSLHSAATTTPAVTANTMVIPAGGREAFGSPAWGAINTWQTRFRYTAGLTANFYLHFTDINNNLQAQVSGTGLILFHVVGGTAHNLGGQSFTLVNGVQYWLQMTQFPSLGQGIAAVNAGPFVQAQVLADNGGLPGTAVAALLGPFQTFDNLTALVGRPQIAASGAALGLGGNFANVHTVSLFGPGGWQFSPSTPGGTATGYSSGAWDGASSQFGMSGNGGANTYPNGPVTSYGAARIDLPPAGNPDATFSFVAGASPATVAGSGLMPVQTAGNVITASYWTKSSGLSATANIRLNVREYDVNGNFLRASVANLTGNQASWVQQSLQVTTGANTAYLDIFVRVVDTTANSANGTVWFDNCQVWDQTRTGMATMPYCELRAAQSPAQLMVSGVIGDEAAPAFVESGLYLASWPNNTTATFRLGRRPVSTPDVQLVVPSSNLSPLLDSTAYAGFVMASNPGPLPQTAAAWAGGNYRILSRAKTGNATPLTVAVNPDTLQILIPSGDTPAQAFQSAANFAAEYTGANTFPFAAQNAWTLCDIGAIYYPPVAVVGLMNPAKVAIVASTRSSGGSAITSNWFALLPADGETAVVGLNNPNTGTTVTQKWLYLYLDSALGVTGLSIETAPLPNPVNAVTNPIVGPAGTVVATPNADQILRLDPALSTPNGTGVNQFCLVATDQSTTVLPVAVEMLYSPQYLYPL